MYKDLSRGKINIEGGSFTKVTKHYTLVSVKIKGLKERRKFMNELKKYQETTFEDIKHINEEGREYW